RAATARSPPARLHAELILRSFFINAEIRFLLRSGFARFRVMTSIAHLSDIHFGAHDPQIVAALEAWLIERQPELVIISGDLTQRARTRQFRQAADFIKRLRSGGVEVLAVPGNHDVP